MRKYIQALSLLLFTLFFFLATYKLPQWFPADLYLRLDPLLGLNAVMASREIIDRVLWSLALVGATLLIGRFFCAYVCPLGAAIDGLDFLFFRKNKRRGLKRDEGLRRGKYFLLIIIIAAAALIGVSLVYLLDPIALLTRFYTFVLYPALIALLNLLLDLIRPLAGALGLASVSHLHYPQPVFYMTSITLLIFGTLIALSYFTPRFWCRYLCPLGAFLSLISPWGLFKRRVGPDCNRCLVCQQRCPMEAIDQDPFNTRLRECIQCRNCALICPQQAISFPAALGGVGEYSRVDVSRRGFVSSLAGGLTLGFLANQTPFTPLQGKNQLIRPPGALPEREFLRTCIRCGECMKACVTNTIQPSLWESGLSGLWTPKLEMRLAACEPNCHVCGRVCPTRAIRDLSLEEKTHAKVGNAVLWKEKCLVWAQNKLCLICDEICPYNAIVFRPIEGYRRPVVIASRCNGCGYCEEKCPVKGESAIVVVPDGEIRLKTGSYVREAKKLQLEFRPDPGDDKFILEESGFRIEGESKAEGMILPAPKRPSRTPGGFL
ncbi:MAG: 4Fe-4S binding protein [Smithellaceae bacterium]|nr:4Fe-4S binding protein [Smithellaceae bacterium]